MTRILIAEDETLIRLDLRAQLEDAGYDVCAEARDGEEAVELAGTTQPDVALLDIRMPKLDGIQAARAILARQSLPIVFVTAFDDGALVRAAANLGAFAYLTKPYPANTLAPAIELAIARHAELTSVREETATLADALAARKAIERAKGLLQQHEQLTENEAFARLRQASQRSGQTIKTIAEAIIVALDPNSDT
jgi:two-component system, response regulator PdtaR